MAVTRRAFLAVGALGVGFATGLVLPRSQEARPAVAGPPPTLAPAPETATPEPPRAAAQPALPPAPPTPAASTPTVARRARPTQTVAPVPVLPTRTAAPAASFFLSAEISHVRTDRRVLALTFDAGADKGETAQTLRVLRERGVRATFFVTGRFAELFPGLVHGMVADGHELANHTYDHRDLVDLSDAQIAAELERTDAVLRRFTGTTTRPLMRAPFGSRDARVRAAIGAAGYRSIYWALDGGDWKPGATPGGVIATLRKAVAGDVVVQHCSTVPTAAALPTVLSDFGKRKLAVVTVSALIA